jgi:hypothetical protein
MEEFPPMKSRQFVLYALVLGAFTSLIALTIFAQQDKYSVKVPGGLAFSEFKGYESWQVISVSHNGNKVAAILGNPEMIDAYKSGIPDNGKPFPDGAKMAKILTKVSAGISRFCRRAAPCSLATRSLSTKFSPLFRFGIFFCSNRGFLYSHTVGVPGSRFKRTSVHDNK